MPKDIAFNRNEVIQNVTSLFQQKGFNGTSMEDIVQVSKLGRSSIYNSFGSKQSLFLEVLKEYGNTYGKLLSKEIENSSNALEAIHNIFKAHVNVIVNDKTCSGCLWVNTKAELWSSDEFMTEVLINSQKNLVNLFLDLVKKGQKEKTINLNNKAKQYALYLMTSLHGLRLTGKSHQDKKDLNNVTNLILKSLE